MTFTEFYLPTKKEILELVSEEAIFEHFLEVKVEPGLFKSPFRKDNSPSCSFIRSRKGDLLLVD